VCGRFSLTHPSRLPDAFPQYRFPEFSETRLPKIRKRYNIAPTDAVLGIRNDGDATAEWMRWGIHGRINIRAESVVARRGPIRRRCVEFADGFYEWRERQPVYYTLRSGEPFAFAGLWESQDGVTHCDIVTCKPNALVAQVHDRMPVILTKSHLDRWLDPDPLPAEVAASMLTPFDPDRMIAREVSRRVNNAKYDEADILESVTGDDMKGA
jgi:putative SOS response-associated peptidase YedK